MIYTAKGRLRFLSQAATYYSKVEVIPLSALPRTQLANLSVYLRTISFLCLKSSREAVNTNF